MPVKDTNYIYRMGTAPNTRAAVSQKNKVFGYSVGSASFQQIGAVSEFGHDESRTIDPVRGVGYGDMIAELVPGVTEPMTLTLNKTLLYTANVFQVVGYKGGVDGLVRSLRHHRWPFDIKQEMVMSEIASLNDDSSLGGGEKPADASSKGQSNITTPAYIRALFTYYEGCWFNSYSASYTSDAAIIAETSSVTVTDIIDGTSQYGEYIDSGLAPVINSGAIGANTSATAGAGYSLRFAGGSQAKAGGITATL